jgi:dynein heavy chain
MIVDTLPALMNAAKMVHTIARYYNTTERMTNLFTKITNQMIWNSKMSILEGEGSDALWGKDPLQLIEKLEACIKLNDVYQEQYRATKETLLQLPKGKQFDFSETLIFGRFDLFCRRVYKLIDMFQTIHQFKSLSQHRFDGMEPLVKTFYRILEDFQIKKHDLMDYQNNQFDRDYVKFNAKIADLETNLRHFINQSFEQIPSIEKSLHLLKKFQSILQRENLRADLESKFAVIFHNYGMSSHKCRTSTRSSRRHHQLSGTSPPLQVISLGRAISTGASKVQCGNSNVIRRSWQGETREN